MFVYVFENIFFFTYFISMKSIWILKSIKIIEIAHILCQSWSSGATCSPLPVAQFPSYAPNNKPQDYPFCRWYSRHNRFLWEHPKLLQDPCNRHSNAMLFSLPRKKSKSSKISISISIWNLSITNNIIY